MLRESALKLARWHKSTRCDANSCVEVAVLPNVVAIRNSTDPDGPVLSFSPDVWRGFVESIRAGELARPGSSS
jgi:Domain of unknown function (DUF397)